MALQGGDVGNGQGTQSGGQMLGRQCAPGLGVPVTRFRSLTSSWKPASRRRPELQSSTKPTGCSLQLDRQSWAALAVLVAVVSLS